MNKTSIIPLLLSFVFLWGCGQGNKEMAMETVADESVAFEPETADIANTTAMSLKSEVTPETQKTGIEKKIFEKKIIRTGNISIESKDLKKSKSTLDLLIKNLGAYYEQESTSSGSTYTNYNLTVRVPSSLFDTLLDSIEKGSDKITEKSIQSQDISLQYYDLESRLKSKRTYLERYQKMVVNAKTVKELLEIEEQIRQLQEEIESAESNLRAMKDQVSYSTLQINLYNSNSIIAHSDSGFWLKIKDAFGFGWQLIENIFIGLVGIWPILILLVTAFFGWKRIRNKKPKN